ncbi:Methionine--tRNA ligase [Buchnera aphidicola (Eriosoma grossulariae)]|uniref:methionine--tRNA ligase n=1 Tax=Buchnera aphidicola TaxID=9 RepID=UPI003463A6BE
MSFSKKKMLVTCAFPYANGSIHIGHLLEQIQADIWVRYQRLRGHIVWFICADDAHGTAIMIKAKNSGLSSENIINATLLEHINDFKSFNISHDNYHTTHSSENLYFLKKFFKILNKKKLINEKNIIQLYDPVEKMFLPDRLIQGQCPICNKHDQYGDNCEQCGSIYDSLELINPISMLSKTKPVLRNSNHLFFNLPYFQDQLKNWIDSGVLQKPVMNKSKEWFKKGLKKWNISRDAPYFGFKIPSYEDKFFYVWLDAPIGYISTFKNLCVKNKNICFDDFWKKDTETLLYHFIGKDIIYFHCLFWPAILDALEFRKPTKIFVHGYVTMKGLKLSKSKNSTILAKDWIRYLDSDTLRYYYASKLSNKIDDIEINLEEVVIKVNSDIVNKVINLASRTAKIINKYFSNKLSDVLDDDNLHSFFLNCSIEIELFLENREYSEAIRKIMNLADIGNKYINSRAPWMILKRKGIVKEVQDVCSMGIHLFRILMIWLKPIVPVLAIKTELLLRSKLSWHMMHSPLLSHEINTFKKLFKRLDINLIKNLLI